MASIAIITMAQQQDLPCARAALQSLANVEAPPGASVTRLILFNDSRDTESEKALAASGNADLITPGRNLGVAMGRNLLVRTAAARGADFVLSIDDDILLPTDFLQRLFQDYNKLSASGDAIGILTPATFDYPSIASTLFREGDKKRISEGEAVPVAATPEIIAKLKAANRVSPDNIYHMGIRDWRGAYLFTDAPADQEILRLYGIDRPIYSGGASNLRRAPEAVRAIESEGEPIPIETAPGGVCFFPVDMFEQINGVDPIFNPFGFEDADFALRASAKGYRHYCTPRAIAIHDIDQRLKKRRLSVVKATQGKFAGIVPRRHLDQHDAPAAFFAITRKVLTDIGAKGRGPVDPKEGPIAPGRLAALWAYAANAFLFLLNTEGTSRDEGSSPVGENLSLGVASFVWAKVPFTHENESRHFESQSALHVDRDENSHSVLDCVTGRPVRDVAMSRCSTTGDLTIDVRQYRGVFKKDLCPPFLHALAPGEDLEFAMGGTLTISKNGAFASPDFFLRVGAGFEVTGRGRLRRGRSRDDAITPLHIEDVAIEIRDEGALPRAVDYLKRIDGLSAKALIDQLIGACGDQVSDVLTDFLTGEDDCFRLSMAGVLDGEPKAPKLSTSFSRSLRACSNEKQKSLLAHNSLSVQPLDDAAAPTSKLQRIQKIFEPDPSVTPFPETYDPGAGTTLFRKFRYLAASRGAPLTPNERRMARFRNYGQGKRAFIIGNGPSLNKIDLTLLKNETTFGVNAIYLNKDKMGFLPTHYVVEDVFVAEDRADEINALAGPTKWIGNYLRYCLSGNDQTCWLNVACDYSNYPGFPHFSPNASRIVWVGGTVSYIVMQLAYYMGFNPVYLIGFDHSYTVPKDAAVKGRAITSQSDDPNHFHPDYFGKGYRWHDPRVDRMETAYRKARAAFEADNRKIYNASAGGRLEVFERVDFASLFGPETTAR
ncbi:MAG: 6-hydroxymethylpterin diphosphokinase MptE-like protein [Pseudomonadota bacterium]